MAEGWSKLASLYDGVVAVGGRMRVGDSRLRFGPHALDRSWGGRELDVPLDAIVRLTLTKRSLLKPRRNVLIETSNGQRARFLVNGAENVVRSLARDAQESGANPEVVGLDH